MVFTVQSAEDSLLAGGDRKELGKATELGLKGGRYVSKTEGKRMGYSKRR